MPDLADQLRHYGNALEAHQARNPVPSLHPQPPRRRRLSLLAAAALVVLLSVVVAVAVSSRGHKARRVTAATTPTVTRPVSPTVSARIVLQSKTIVAGSTRAAELVVTNRTGKPVDGIACESPFALALGNESVQQDIVFLQCRRPFQVPIGQSRYPLTIFATYLGCSPNGPGPDGPAPKCVDGNPPPLPTGRYRLRLVQAGQFVSAPKPLTIHVTRSPKGATPTAHN